MNDNALWEKGGKGKQNKEKMKTESRKMGGEEKKEKFSSTERWNITN